MIKIKILLETFFLRVRLFFVNFVNTVKEFIALYEYELNREKQKDPLYTQYGRAKKRTVAIGGGIITAIISLVMAIVLFVNVFPALWPVAANTTAITAMTTTDQGTVLVKALIGVVLLIAGIAVVVMLIRYVMKSTGMGNL